ncbi:sensor histidine kinase [Xylanibacter oryzae]|uniref:sensor histidine kinase n=1 Tax=Xylanibacter oryzae TaxID=185293 RepID=UPI000561D4C2|nr:histidine kinase [Xylanibacter oryzae]
MKKGFYNGILLYAKLWFIAIVVSFVFIYVMGYGDPDDTKVAYTLYDFLLDGTMMAAYLSISLLFNYFFIRIFQPLQHYSSKMFIYSIMLLSTNLLTAILMTKGLTLIWGALPRQEYIKTVYLFCLVATFISGIHANISFQKIYKSQAEEKHHLEMDNIRQREINLQTSLIALKTQVDPHFLFNNFSILSDLIEESPKEAHEFLESLSRVYRYKLVNMSTHLVSVDNELRMLRSYVHLVSTRFGNAIRVIFPTAEQLTTIQTLGVPPLVIQLLVENAIKHNAHSAAHPLVVNIRIDQQHIVVSNPIMHLSSEVESTKLGLANLQQRYRLLSDEQPTINCDGQNFTVILPLIKLGK